MSNSVKIVKEGKRFKYRVSGVVIQDNKLLVTEMNHSNNYLLPGGYIELFEKSDVAAIREMEEEVGIEFNIVKYYGMIENFFHNNKDEDVHEIGIYYLLEAKDKDYKIIDFERDEEDKGRIIHHSFKMININELRNTSFKPLLLIEKLENKDYNIFHEIQE